MVLKLKGKKKDVPLYTRKILLEENFHQFCHLFQLVKFLSASVNIFSHVNNYRDRCGDLYHIGEKKKNFFVIPTEARLGESFLFQLYNITNLFNLHTHNVTIILH